MPDSISESSSLPTEPTPPLNRTSNSGKARSSQNARKHGFTAATFCVLVLEDLDEVTRLKEEYRGPPPANPLELFALEQVAIAQQSLRRAARMEAGFFMACLHRAHLTADSAARTTEELTGDADVTRQQHLNFRLAEGLHRMSQDSNAWTQLLRYQAQAQRKYRFAVEEFKRLLEQRTELYHGEFQNEPNFDAEL